MQFLFLKIRLIRSIFVCRGLPETVKILKSQMLDLQTQVAQLCKQLEEERKSRLSLAATVKRSIAVIDGSMP